MSSGIGYGYIAGVLNSPEEYIQLVFDLLTIGSHNINPYGQTDKDNLSLSDYFYRLEETIAEEYLGIIFPWSKCPPQNHVFYTAEEWDYITEQEERHLESIEPLQLSDLIMSSDPKFPQPENFPIAIFWQWEDTFDRCGDIVFRHFNWIPLSQNIFLDSVSEPVRKHTIWTQRYKPLHEYCCEMQQFMNSNNYKFGDPETDAILTAQSKLLKEKWGIVEL